MSERISGLRGIEIEGMSCGHCVAEVSQVLRAVPGVEVRSVAIGRAEVVVASEGAADAALTALRETGYECRSARPAAGETEPRSRCDHGRSCCG